MEEILRYKDQLKVMADEFDKQQHCLSLTLIYYQPKDILFTKNGHVSRRSQDLSNVEKMLVDIICDPRFNGREIGSQSFQNLDCDDTAVVQLLSMKRECASDRFLIEVELCVHELEELNKQVGQY